MRGRTQLGAVVGLYANRVPPGLVSVVIRIYRFDSHRRVIVLAQRALCLRDFPSARIDDCGGTGGLRTESWREVIADTMSWYYMLAGLAVANGADVLRRLTSHRIDVHGRIAFVEVIAQRRRAPAEEVR